MSDILIKEKKKILQDISEKDSALCFQLNTIVEKLDKNEKYNDITFDINILTEIISSLEKSKNVLSSIHLIEIEREKKNTLNK